MSLGSVGAEVGKKAAGNKAVAMLGVTGTLVGIASTLYKDELRGFAHAKLLSLVRSGLLSKERLGLDLAYIIDFEQKYAALSQNLPEDRSVALLNLMANYLRLLKQGTVSNFLVSFRNGINALFDLPLQFHPSFDTAVVDELKRQVTQDYPQIEALVNNYIDQLTQYINDKNNNVRSPKPNPLLLLGPAGVGKTRLVQELISSKLGIPCYRASVANQRTAVLEGDCSANLCNTFDEGILFKALLHASRTNSGRGPVIVFLDDICSAFTKGTEEATQQEVLTWLTYILDPARTDVISNLFNRYGSEHGTIHGIKLNMDDFIFIAAANSRHFIKTEGLDRRLRSRITFPALTVDKKREIAINYCNSQATEFCILLTEEDNRAIQMIAEIDPYPGAGTMLDTLNKWFASKRIGSVFNIQTYYDSLTVQDLLPIEHATFTPLADNRFKSNAGTSSAPQTYTDVYTRAGSSTEPGKDDVEFAAISDAKSDDELEQFTTEFLQKMSLVDPKEQAAMLRALIGQGSSCQTRVKPR